jgi:acetyltransferase-like isoleucine patch superfamily enzyme
LVVITVPRDPCMGGGTHDYTRPEPPLLRSPITIGSGVWVCADAFMGPGVTIGDDSVVGARAVVVRDAPPGVVAAGNPARVTRRRPAPREGAARLTTVWRGAILVHQGFQRETHAWASIFRTEK